MLAVFLMNKDVYIAHIPNAPWFSSETLALLRLRLSSIFVDKSLTYLLTYFQTRVGGDVQAALGTGGLTNSAGTTVHLLLTSGDQPSHGGTRGVTLRSSTTTR